jgi:membrane protein
VIRQAGRLAWRAFNRFHEHNGPDHAAAVAYYTLLSLLPLLIFMISLGVAVVGSFERAYEGTLFIMGGVMVHMDQPTREALRSFVERALRFQWPAIVLLAWTSRRIFSALFSALEKVFGVPGRGFVPGNLMALATVFTAGLGLLMTMASTMVIATAEGLVARVTGPESAGAIHAFLGVMVARVVPVLVTFTFFFLVYRVIPRRVVTSKHAAIGAALATLLWELAKAAFAYYLRDLARYAGVYGTLEGVIVLAIWLELSVSIVLFCGEIVALLIPARKPVKSVAPPREAVPVGLPVAINEK